MNSIMNEIISNVKDLEHWMYAENETPEKYKNGMIRPEYGWHNQKLPPEFRKACLKRTEFDTDRNTCLYFLMCEWYERISGCKAPCNFEVYGSWKKKLRTGGKENYGLKEQEICRLIVAIQAGTCFSREKRDCIKVMDALTECEG